MWSRVVCNLETPHKRVGTSTWLAVMVDFKLLVASPLMVPFLPARQSQSYCGMFLLQAAQVRKSNYVPEKGVDYDPDKHHTCTVYAGTMVQQVSPQVPSVVQTLMNSLLTLCMQGPCCNELLFYLCTCKPLLLFFQAIAQFLLSAAVLSQLFSLN